MMLDVALSCIARGWHVFPCWPKTKTPMTRHGWHDATLDGARVREWWTRKPDANVAIACGPSNLCVVDIDHGLGAAGLVHPVFAALGMEGAAYIVRTGRRPEIGLQVYFEGAVPDVGLWKAEGCEGQVKSLGGYVMAAGSIHPDSHEAYIDVVDGKPSPTPADVRALKSERQASVVDDGGPIKSNRNVTLTSIAGKLRNAGLSADELEQTLSSINERRCVPPLDEAEVRRIAENASRWELPKPDAVATLQRPSKGQMKSGAGVDAEVLQRSLDGPFTGDWRTLFDSLEQLRDAPEASFLIDGFLEEDALTGIAAGVGQRKSLVALNIVHSLLTGEPLFGKFEVRKKPSRVLWLCPEMGRNSFGARLKAIGLLDFVGKSLFCTTTATDKLGLEEIPAEARAGSVVVIDTAVRFTKGEENSPAEMKVFSDTLLSLLRGEDRASAVIVLYHSPKETRNAADLTLENSIRGTGEFGASLGCCWATRLQDQNNTHSSKSYLKNVKERNFESRPFEIGPVGDCRFRFCDDAVVALKKYNPNPGNIDGRDGDAEALISAHSSKSWRQVQDELRAAGIERGQKWISKRLTEARAPSRKAGATRTQG